MYELVRLPLKNLVHGRHDVVYMLAYVLRPVREDCTEIRYADLLTSQAGKNAVTRVR
jgi:hypothetical protein